MTAYGRSLLDILFSREEQGSSVVLKTKMSPKPPLSPGRVQMLFGKKLCITHDTCNDVGIVLLDCVQLKYPKYDHKALMASLGQKCRDRFREMKTSEPSH